MGAPLGRTLPCPVANPNTAVEVQLRRLRLGGPALGSHALSTVWEHLAGGQAHVGTGLGGSAGWAAPAGPRGAGGGLQNPGRWPGGSGWRLGPNGGLWTVTMEGAARTRGRRPSQDLRLLCAWPRGTRLSWPLLLGPLHAPSWATGLLWSRPRSPRTVCPVSSPVRPAAPGDCSDVQFCVPVRLSSVSFTEGLG